MITKLIGKSGLILLSISAGLIITGLVLAAIENLSNLRDLFVGAMIFALIWWLIMDKIVLKRIHRKAEEQARGRADRLFLHSRE